MALVKINYIGYAADICYAKTSAMRLTDCLLKKERPYNHDIVAIEIEYSNVGYLIVNRDYRYLVESSRMEVILVDDLVHLPRVRMGSDLIKINRHALAVDISGKGVEAVVDAVWPRVLDSGAKGFMNFTANDELRFISFLERGFHGNEVRGKMHFR